MVRSKSTSTFKVYDPATQELIIELPDQTPEEIDEVIAITHKAFQTYQRTPVYERAKWLRRMYELMTENLQDLATLITWENGKCLADALGKSNMQLVILNGFQKNVNVIMVIPYNH